VTGARVSTGTVRKRVLLGLLTTVGTGGASELVAMEGGWRGARPSEMPISVFGYFRLRRGIEGSVSSSKNGLVALTEHTEPLRFRLFDAFEPSESAESI
jgi:hypothetical protein